MVLHYSDNGSGEPVVLLHGMAASLHYWDEFSSLLKGRRIIALDLLGFGRSPKPKHSPYDYTAHLLSIIETLQQLGVTEPFTLVGHSMGALLALRLAAQYPEKVKKLVLLAMPIYANAEAARLSITGGSRLKKLVYYGPTSHVLCTTWCKISRPLSRRVAPLYLQHVSKKTAQDSVLHSWRSYSQSMCNIIENQQVSQDLARLKIPVAFIAGSEDSAAAPDRIIPPLKSSNLTLIVLAGTHQILYEHPARIAQAILQSKK